MKKTIVTLALALTAGTAGAAQLIEAIVVRVGDRIITRTQYQKRLSDALNEVEVSTPPDQRAARRKEIRDGLLNELISELLIKDRADRLGITVTEAEVQDAVTRLKQQYSITSDAQFNESLQKSGMTRPEMEARLRETLLTNKVFGRELRSREDLSDTELRERYNREKDRLRLPERARLRAIIVEKPEGAATARMKARVDEIAAAARKTGADFTKLAGETTESALKDKAGEMGEVARGELVADLDKAVFNSAPGTILGPIETSSAWHIIRVENRLPSEVPAFESIKDKLRKDVSEEAWQRDYTAYIERLRKEAFIQINEQNVPTT